MNTPTPTPRTDAAWAKTFDEDENQCRAGNAATDMRDECAKIERELAALTAERDQLRAEVHRLKKQAVFDADHVHALNLGFATRAEVERSDALYQRACEVEEELRAEVKRMTHAYEYDHKCLYEVRDRCHLWKQRAEKAEAQLHALRLVCGTTDANKFETWTDRANARAKRAEAELAAAKERLRSEAMDDYASIKDLQRELATEREKVRVLRLACERLRDCDWVISLPDRMDAVREIAREALKKMEGEK